MDILLLSLFVVLCIATCVPIFIRELTKSAYTYGNKGTKKAVKKAKKK